MASKLETLLSEVLKEATPSLEERRHVLTLAKKLSERVEEAAKKARVDIEVRVEGSIAKDTWSRELPDIDIFMRVPPDVPRESFGTVYLDIAKEATADAEQFERFAEHPYLEAIVDGTRVNIVPCYRVERGAWKSATDRTPFHTDYVKPLLNEELCGEIRLLKLFMRSVRVYGAEIKVGGFSGYLCELLVLFYGSFVQVLEAAADWKPQILIDLERHYKEREGELKRIFEEPLVVVDPVDEGRNVASAVREERLHEFVAASRALLDKPSREFFYPPEATPFTSAELSRAIGNRGLSLVFVVFGRVDAVPDVLWGQLYKSQKSLRKVARQHEFCIIRDAVWSDEKSLNVFILEAQHRFLPHARKHIGPPLDRSAECGRFLEKHVDSARTLSGPRIEEGRWVVEIEREYTDLVELLKAELEDGGRDVGLAELVSRAVAEQATVLVNEEILPAYSSNQSFAQFLTEYIEGRPRWLT